MKHSGPIQGALEGEGGETQNAQEVEGERYREAQLVAIIGTTPSSSSSSLLSLQVLEGH